MRVLINIGLYYKLISYIIWTIEHVRHE